MPAPIIALDQVSLSYRLARQRFTSVKEYALHWVTGGLVYQDLWALREVSLVVEAGESVGIVGPNGAGKSTLLKVISGVLRPTRGRLAVQGRVAPLLELGTGFDEDLTGAENIRLNALLLGHRQRDIADRTAEIVAFSGLGDFIRSPLRNYSSGMVARLAFSVLTAWTPDILILDEFFAVGDARFAARCQDRLRVLRAAGTTLLLVSHSPEAILDTCPRSIWLEGGRLRADGPSAEILRRYAEASSGS
jgi:ABC-type polysaccharide/polyol phosphate transport system ATPase subunit